LEAVKSPVILLFNRCPISAETYKIAGFDEIVFNFNENGRFGLRGLKGVLWERREQGIAGKVGKGHLWLAFWMRYRIV